jgi:four helix bundle protein
MKTHKDLDVWKNSIELVKAVYKITSNFPKEELYSFTNQIRRAAVSIPSNLAEGAGRNHNKEFIQFLYIAQGSLSELETQLIIAKELDFIKGDILESLIIRLNQIRAQLVGLIKYLQKKSK